MTPLEHSTTRSWPGAVALVLIGYLVAGWSLFIASIGVASFFGDTASRGSYLEGGVVSLTAALAVALIWLAGRLQGLGGWLWLLVLPLVALVATGINLLTTEGDPMDADAGRAVQISDLWSDATILNWIVIALGALYVVIVWSRRRAETS